MFNPVEVVGPANFQVTYLNQDAIETVIVSHLVRFGSADLIFTVLPSIDQFSQEFWVSLESRGIKLKERFCDAFLEKSQNIPDQDYLVRMVKKCNWQISEKSLDHYPFHFSPQIYECLYRLEEDAIHHVVIKLLGKGIIPTAKGISSLLCSPCSIETLSVCLAAARAGGFSSDEKRKLLDEAAFCSNPGRAILVLHDLYEARPGPGSFEKIFHCFEGVAEDVREDFFKILLTIMKKSQDLNLYSCAVLNLAILHKAPQEMITYIESRLEHGEENLVTRYLKGDLDPKLIAPSQLEGVDPIPTDVFNAMLLSGLAEEQAARALSRVEQLDCLTSVLAMRRGFSQELVLQINDLVFFEID